MTINNLNKKVNVTLRKYQEEAIDFLNSNDGKLVLAMCPSSGKTETIIHYLNQVHNLQPNLKVLILPHSTNVLLDNFYQRLNDRDVNFTYSNDINEDVNVHVILPQNHNRIVGKYDIIIVDEAHENYSAKTIQGIIRKTQPEKEILLTGTPYKIENLDSMDEQAWDMFFTGLSLTDENIKKSLDKHIIIYQKAKDLKSENFRTAMRMARYDQLIEQFYEEN